MGLNILFVNFIIAIVCLLMHRIITIGKYEIHNRSLIVFICLLPVVNIILVCLYIFKWGNSRMIEYLEFIVDQNIDKTDKF